MFSSKSKQTQPSAPEMPWDIQILTTEYLIDGKVEPAEYKRAGHNAFMQATLGVAKIFGKIRLTSVQVQPTGNLLTPAQFFPEWRLTTPVSIVAVILNDDGSRQAAQTVFKDFKYPVKAIIYAGAYRIRGTVLVAGVDGYRLYAPTSAEPIPMQDVEITSQLPGAKISSLQAPWLLLNGGMIHGLGVDEAS